MISNTKVRLVGYTQPSEEFVGEFDDVKDLIAYCARVSNPSNQLNKETSDRLLRYLIKHKHWSPFEIASATVEIETTRDIARQILRHRSFQFQEFSQRYSADFDEFVIREVRLQDTKNRQNSFETDDDEINTWWRYRQKEIAEKVKEVYNEALERGIAKEQARVILPEGMTPSRMYMQGTIRSFIHYIDLRTGNGTQKEHIEVASAVAEAISKIFNFSELRKE